VTKLKQKKIRKSVRLTPQNFDLIRNIADTCFREDDEVEGNFSESLNFLIELIRIKSQWKEDFQAFEYRARYLRGERTNEVLEGMKRAELIMMKWLLEHT
jgi:hypothetical protein